MKTCRGLFVLHFVDSRVASFHKNTVGASRKDNILKQRRLVPFLGTGAKKIVDGRRRRFFYPKLVVNGIFLGAASALDSR